MPAFGGMTPYPRKFGGGKPRIQTFTEALATSRGSAYDASTWSTAVYCENTAIARALDAAWATNARAANVWNPYRCGMEIISRWENILSLPQLPSLTDYDRRVRVASVLGRFGSAIVDTLLTSILTSALGSVFVSLEHITFANANITVPDASYPWGVVAATQNGDTPPWTSTVAHILVRLQAPTGMSEADFYSAAGQVNTLLDPILPVWTTFDWYRAGVTPVNVTGGPSAGGFFLDDTHNLDNECFDV